MKHTYYLITSRHESIAPFTVRAENYEHAAQIAARRLVGRKRGLFARRVTGDSDKSGYYQAYVQVRHGSSARWEASSYDRSFHVREA